MTTLASIAPVSIRFRDDYRDTRARSLRPAVRASPRRNKGVVICEAAADKDFACRVASLAAAIAVVAYEPLPAIAAFGQSTIELSNITYTVVECPTGKRSMTQGKPACLLVKADSVNTGRQAPGSGCRHWQWRTQKCRQCRYGGSHCGVSATGRR